MIKEQAQPRETLGRPREETLVSPGFQTPDTEVEWSLRPSYLRDYIGQDAIKEQLEIVIGAARQRGDALDHVLLYGPPGLGKTTLANIIAREMGVQIRTTSGPAIERAGDLASILTGLKDRDVLFIDEIHRLNTAVAEVLYPAMEDFKLDIILGKGPGARSIRLDLKRFTLVGATTRAGMLASPLRDRFGMLCRLEPYSQEDLRLILDRNAEILRVALEKDGAAEIAARARSTPRVANRLLRLVRDYAQIRSDGVITREVADAALSLLGVDKLGLDATDRKLLKLMIENFGGGPVGLDTLSASSDEDAGTIEDMIEPYLLQLGFVNRTPRGRMALPRAYEHMGYPAPAEARADMRQINLLEDGD